MGVRMVHPDLPGQRIEVDERAVPHHANSGWVLEETPPEDEPAGATDSEPAPEKPSRRRTTKESEA